MAVSGAIQVRLALDAVGLSLTGKKPWEEVLRSRCLKMKVSSCLCGQIGAQGAVIRHT